MKISKVIYTLLFITTLTFLIYFTVDTFNSISTSVTLYIEKVFPSLFLFVLFTNIILSSNIIYIISDSLCFITKLFKLPSKAAMPIILGFLCGFPSASQAIDKLYKDNALSKAQCDFLMFFCNNASPTFIISTIGFGMLSSKKVGVILAVIHIFSSIIMAFLYKLFKYNSIIQENYENLKSNEEIFQDIAILKIVPSAILNTFKTMLYILGYMILFNILADILTNLNISCINYISATFELTKGISFLANYTNIPFISFLIGFSSFSIIFQIKSSLKNFNYSLQKIIFSKFIHGLLSMFISFIIF